MSWKRTSVSALFLLLALFAFKWVSSPVNAERTRDGAVFTVNSTTDAVDATPGDGLCADAAKRCTLRAAIQETNTLTGADTIILPSGTYTLTIAGVDEDLAATGDLDIVDSLTISGAGANHTAIDANELDRVLHIAVNGTVTLDDLSITNGLVGHQGASQDGGGIKVETGTVEINDTRIVRNEAQENGGGWSHGGGIHNEGILLLNDTIVANNLAGSYTIGEGVGGGIANAGTATLTNSSIRRNSSSSPGLLFFGDAGGIFNETGGTLTLVDCSVEENRTDGGGGGIRNSGVLTLKDTTVSDNVAEWLDGGGILNAGGTVSVERTTISDNEAQMESHGGGLANDDGGSVALSNSTVSGNSAWNGGGIGNITGTVTLESSTIAFNTSGENGGGVWNDGATVLKNTILARNTGAGGASDCFGTLTSQDYNLVQSTNDCLLTGDTARSLIGLDPLLGPLGDNGGPTWTHDLVHDSPALDAGGDAGCPAVDQRGFHRPFDGDSDGAAVCDIGATEYRVWQDTSFLPIVTRP